MAPINATNQGFFLTNDMSLSNVPIEKSINLLFISCKITKKLLSLQESTT